jgi:hypothetical protein
VAKHTRFALTSMSAVTIDSIRAARGHCLLITAVLNSRSSLSDRTTSPSASMVIRPRVEPWIP